MTYRQIDMDDLLHKIATTVQSLPSNQHFMQTLVEWAWPITDEDIERYIRVCLKSDGERAKAKQRILLARTRYSRS